MLSQGARSMLQAGRCSLQVNQARHHMAAAAQPCARRAFACTAKLETAEGSQASPPRRKPVLLVDVMDTVCYDPFYQEMPKFFQITFKELLESKHPTAWVEFERSLITEGELFAKFFQDGRIFDGAALVEHMVQSYRFLDGMEGLLQRLKESGYELHAMSNYPIWYRYIEEKLHLSRFLQWTFISCEGPMQGHRKPSPESFHCAVSHLQVPSSDLLLIDDRQQNVAAARAAGLQAIRFESAEQVEEDLRTAGLRF